MSATKHAPRHAKKRVSKVRPRVTMAAAGAGLTMAAGLVAATPAQAINDVTLHPTAHPTLRLGDRGEPVRILKVKLGFDNPNGYYSDYVKFRVKYFEWKNGLKPDGVVDTLVWRKLGVPLLKKPEPGTQRFADIVLTVAKHYEGKPYVYGAEGPNAFDCSGYVGYVFDKALGIDLPRSSGSITYATNRVSSQYKRPGDIVFVNKGSGVSHVAIYAGNGKWWESTRPGEYTDLNSAWTSSVFYGRVKA